MRAAEGKFLFAIALAKERDRERASERASESLLVAILVKAVSGSRPPPRQKRASNRE